MYEDLIAEIKAAYLKLGYKPIRRRMFCHQEKLCCPLGALMLVDQNMIPSERFGPGWAAGFTDAIDRYPKNEYCAKEGYEAGLAVSKAVFGEN